MMGWVCRDGNLADDYAAPLSDRVKHTEWFQDAHLSTWAFSAILDLVEDAGGNWSFWKTRCIRATWNWRTRPRWMRTST